MRAISIDDCKQAFEKNGSVLSLLNDEEKQLLRSTVSCISYDRGDVIFSEGDRCVGLLFMVEGKVKIFKEGIGGREQIVRLARPVGFVGYRSFLAEEPHSTSAIAMEPTIICVISREIFVKIIQSNTAITMALFKAFATELGLTYNRTITLTQKHIRGRLAESLIFIRNTYGVEEDGATLLVSMTREELANLSNMTTSNAIRTLSSFAAEGVVAISGRKIKILDYNKLLRISELG
jgi:CRP-like cAMP-binding protein